MPGSAVDLGRAALASTLGLLTAGASSAQDRADSEMIVTATRVQQSLLDHPGSITRLAVEDIAARGATHHSEIMNRVAGTMTQRGSGQESLTARVEWRPSVDWYTDAELVSVGEYFVDAANQNSYEGHELVNLGLGWQFAAGWHASLRVNNLFDAAYADRADFAFGNYRYFPGRRRTGFVEIGYAFD